MAETSKWFQYNQPNMKSALIASIAILLHLLLYSCRQSANGTLNYSKLNYDTSRIVIFNWDTVKVSFPSNSEPLPLTQQDLFVIDSFITDGINTFNANVNSNLKTLTSKEVPIDLYLINQAEFKYQFFPYIDVNGERVVSVIGFSNNFTFWRTEPYMGRPHFGITEIGLMVNLSRNTSNKFYTCCYG